MSATHKQLGDAVSSGIDGLLLASIAMLLLALMVEGIRDSVWLFLAPTLIAIGAGLLSIAKSQA